MKILPLSGMCNYNAQNPKKAQGNVNFGAIRFIATPTNYKQLERERGFNSVPLTTFINKFNLASPFKKALERWLPGHVEEHGIVTACEEDILFNPREAGRLEMLLRNLFSRKRNQDITSAQKYEPLEKAIDEYVSAIKEPSEICEKAA